MNYVEYKNQVRDITKNALNQFAKGNTRALLIGKQRLIGLKDHFKEVRIESSHA